MFAAEPTRYGISNRAGSTTHVRVKRPHETVVLAIDIQNHTQYLDSTPKSHTGIQHSREKFSLGRHVGQAVDISPLSVCQHTIASQFNSRSIQISRSQPTKMRSTLDLLIDSLGMTAIVNLLSC